jgi:SAM-dependent methyltransferase
MTFEQLQETWTVLGEKDPLWAILTDHEKQGSKWDRSAFFASGVAEIAFLLREIDGLGVPLTFGKALDFGCGVGRLTRALGTHFAEAHGVDIAATMLELAAQFNADRDNLTFHLNQRPDLSLFESDSFDFIYSRIVLQHMAPEFARSYIAEFLRVLAPGGLLAFQVPAGPPDTGLSPALEPLVRPSVYFVADLDVVKAPRRFRPAAPHRVCVRVRNASRSQWIADAGDGRGGGISVGNHWVTVDGCMTQVDDGRTQITESLRPGDATEVDLTVNAPPGPGTHVLEIDLVEEHVAWFADKGSAAVVMPLHVARPLVRRVLSRIRAAVWPRPEPIESEVDLSAEATERIDDRPQFEMHSIPPDDVAATIAQAGGQIVAVQPDGSAGREWASYFYFATKPRV